ncbi:glycosyltransferase family 2 protein [Pseudarthrobacter sp. Y6]|uniref:glycosyltransferase family 2 protein n=1 Tax=Pseudarthrobacter sp. Y6 TaxID=3418422 RepID=UPI003CF2A278
MQEYGVGPALVHDGGRWQFRRIGPKGLGVRALIHSQAFSQREGYPLYRISPPMHLTDHSALPPPPLALAEHEIPYVGRDIEASTRYWCLPSRAGHTLLAKALYKRHEVVRHLSISTQSPISFSKPAAEPERASISVVIPTLNEAKNVPWVLRRMPLYVDEVVIVDGRSRDNTVGVARALRRDIVVLDEQRKDKGVALWSGFAAATGDIIVMLDADGSMDPQEIGWFVSPLQHDYDFVKGSRYVTGGGSEDLPWLRRTGNRALTGLANAVLHSNYSDLCYGYIAFRRSIWKFCSRNPTDTDPKSVLPVMSVA